MDDADFTDSDQDLISYFDDLLIDCSETKVDSPKLDTAHQLAGGNHKPERVSKDQSGKPISADEESRFGVDKDLHAEYLQSKGYSSKNSRTEPVLKAVDAEPVKSASVQKLSKPLLSAQKKERLQNLLSTGIDSKKDEVAVAVENKRQNADENIHSPLQKPVELRQHDALSSVSQSQSPNPTPWPDNGRPSWAQEKFDVLLFQVSGLTLAVPLVSLGQIVSIDDQLTPIFGQADYFMGLLPSPLGQLKLINTSLFVMPERYKPELISDVKYGISIDNQPWALAVDSVNQPITIFPDEVKWRSQRSSRQWLAGTVKSRMCALIDIPNMATILNEANV